ETAKLLSESILKSSSIDETSPKELKGWHKAGGTPDDYKVGIDRQETYHGKPSGYIKAREAPRGFGTLMQTFSAKNYEGTRLRLTANAKSLSVEDWAAFWMRVDGANGGLAFDNMQDRPIAGTTGWTKYQIVLDVAVDARDIAFGILLSGRGQVWINGIEFDMVAANVPTTDRANPTEPVNLNFEE